MRTVQSSTLERMQSLLDGFQELADAVLRHLYPGLRALKSHGVNLEGKPIRGVPDSYVGSSPADCKVAIEHTTTKLSGLAKKFEADLDDVLTRCPSCKTIYLCTNRPETKGLDAAVRAKAKAKGKRLHIVWGELFAKTLDDQRQDLRYRFLGIPIGTLTRHTVRGALEARLTVCLREYLGPEEVRALSGRIRRLPMETEFRKLDPLRTGLTLVSAEAGQGKSNWSAAAAVALSARAPTIWMPARTLLEFGSVDRLLVDAAYGSRGEGRVHELASVVRRSPLRLVAFLDGLDECADYGRVLEMLRAFGAMSALADSTHLVVTCRTEALEAFDTVQPGVLPDPSGNRRLDMDRLRESEAAQLLSRLGTSRAGIAELKASLPTDLYRNPLFIKLARAVPEREALGPAPEAWLERFVVHFQAEIRQRLRSAGAAPKSSVVRTALTELALGTLADPRGVQPNSLAHQLLRTHLDGEGTFVERAVQCGLLVRGVDDRVRFCHALFAEYLVAERIVGDSAKTPDEKVRDIARLPGRRSIARFACRRDPALLSAFATHRVDLVDSFEVAGLDPEVVGTLEERGGALLLSESPFERNAAVRILVSLRTRRAIEIAGAWFNELEPAVRVARLVEASELFLGLEQRGAAQVVVLHQAFAADLMAFFDPGFAERLSQLGAAFRNSLAEYAATELGRDIEATEAHHEVRLTMVLAYLRDSRLLERLRAKAELLPLAGYEHRALIHLNTDEAMEVYLASRDHYFAQLDAIVPGSDETNRKRSALWHDLVPRQNDMVRFPHDAVVRLAGKLLTSDAEPDASFGAALAEAVPDPTLIEPYAEMVAERSRQGHLWLGDTIDGIVANLDSDRVVSMYRRVGSDDARRAILGAMGSVASAETEQLLIDELANPELFQAACWGLAEMGSERAGTHIHALLANLTGGARSAAIQALGRARYEPVVPELIKELSALPVDGMRDAATSSAAHSLVMALGQIGTTEAHRALAARFERRPDYIILSFLVDAAASDNENALGLVHDLLDGVPATRRLLPPALDHRKLLYGGTVIYAIDEIRRPDLDDEKLLSALLETARESLAGTAAAGLSDFHVPRAVAMFDLPAATEFLSELAEEEPEGAAERMTMWFAREALAQRGVVKWIEERIESVLDDIAGRQFVISGDRERLNRWEPDTVRSALRRRIERADGRVEKWLYLLLPVATADDHKWIRLKLACLPPGVADSISEHLPEPGQLALEEGR